VPPPPPPSCLPQFPCVETDALPRQAREKRNENSHERAFHAGAPAATDGHASVETTGKRERNATVSAVPERQDGGARVWTLRPRCGKRVFLRALMLNTIILPRQARGKREATMRTRVVSAGCNCSACPPSIAQRNAKAMRPTVEAAQHVAGAKFFGYGFDERCG
jgi:hypothetical protein